MRSSALREFVNCCAFPVRAEASDAVDYAKFYNRSHDAVICVYDDVGNVIETHEHEGAFKDP